jgi:hypothetical protein
MTDKTNTAGVDLAKLQAIADRVDARGLFNASCDIREWIEETRAALALPRVTEQADASAFTSQIMAKLDEYGLAVRDDNGDWRSRVRGEIFDAVYDRAALTQAAPEAHADAKDRRILFLEGLVRAYGPKSLQYDIEHPNDGLNADAPAAQQEGAAGDDFAHIKRLSQATTRAYEPVYQVWQTAGAGGWLDTDKDHYDSTPENSRRITYTPAATTASAPTPDRNVPLSEAEFLSKRLSRVARLAGVTMPSMSHEDIAAVAGTILGEIAFKLEREPHASNAGEDTALEIAAEALRGAKRELDYIQSRQCGSGAHVDAAHRYQHAIAKLVDAAIAASAAQEKKNV